jgi:hypothetical protein
MCEREREKCREGCFVGKNLLIREFDLYKVSKDLKT